MAFLYQISCQFTTCSSRQQAAKLNNQSRTSIEKVTGISYEDLMAMDIDSIESKIEKKIGKKLKFKSITDSRLVGRGSVYAYLNRLFDIDTMKLNRYIDNIFN